MHSAVFSAYANVDSHFPCKKNEKMVHLLRQLMQLFTSLSNKSLIVWIVQIQTMAAKNICSSYITPNGKAINFYSPIWWQCADSIGIPFTLFNSICFISSSPMWALINWFMLCRESSLSSVTETNHSFQLLKKVEKKAFDCQKIVEFWKVAITIAKEESNHWGVFLISL